MGHHVAGLRLNWLAFIVLHASGAAAEIMCGDSFPLVSPKTLETVRYPAMVTASQCRCTLLPAQPVDGFNINIWLKRSDLTDDCSHTQVTIRYRGHSTIVCPTPDNLPPNTSALMESITLAMTDRPVITLWNTYREFINAEFAFSSDYPVAYNVSCVNVEGSFFWPFEEHGAGFDDGIDSGIKVAVVVLFFILAVLISATIRLTLRVRRRKARFKKRKEHAQQTRIDHLIQTNAFVNLGIANSPPQHNASGNYTAFRDQSSSPNDSTTPRNDNYPVPMPRTFTGQGSIWPLQNEEHYEQPGNQSDIPDVFSAKRTPSTHQSGTSESESVQKPLSKHYQKQASAESTRTNGSFSSSVKQTTDSRSVDERSPYGDRRNFKKLADSNKNKARNSYGTNRQYYTDVMPKDDPPPNYSTATEYQNYNMDSSKTSRESAV